MRGWSGGSGNWAAWPSAQRKSHVHRLWRHRNYGAEWSGSGGLGGRREENTWHSEKRDENILKVAVLESGSLSTKEIWRAAHQRLTGGTWPKHCQPTETMCTLRVDPRNRTLGSGLVWGCNSLETELLVTVFSFDTAHPPSPPCWGRKMICREKGPKP